MSTEMHKKQPEQQQIRKQKNQRIDYKNNNEDNDGDHNNLNKQKNVSSSSTTIPSSSRIESGELEQENRQAKILALHSKGLTQSEIAGKLGVDQSTVSRDLNHIKKESRNYIEKYVAETVPFEFNSCLTGLGQIIKKLWDIIEEDDGKDGTTTSKDRMAAITLLMKCYRTRLDILIGGPESKMNAKTYISHIKQKEELENDPFYQALKSRSLGNYNG